MEKQRLYYFDTLRFLAIMIVFSTHYINEFDPGLFSYYFTYPYTIVLGGLTGKFGLSCLLVVLGYFAYRKGERSDKDLFLLTIQRYLYFVVSAVILYIAAIAVKYIDMHEEGKNVVLVFLRESFFLHDTYYPLFWCLMPMLVGTAVCYMLGRAKANWEIILLTMLIFHFSGGKWTVICILGTFLCRIEKYTKLDGFLKKWWVQLILVLVPFALTHQGPNESTLIYYIGGFFWFCFILATMKGNVLKKILNAKPWRLVNRSYYGIFLLHVLVYDTLGRMLLEKTLLKIPFAPRFVLVFLIITVFLILVSHPLNFCINWASGQLNRLTERLYDRIRRFYAERSTTNGN